MRTASHHAPPPTPPPPLPTSPSARSPPRQDTHQSSRSLLRNRARAWGTVEQRAAAGAGGHVPSGKWPHACWTCDLLRDNLQFIGRVSNKNCMHSSIEHALALFRAQSTGRFVLEHRACTQSFSVLPIYASRSWVVVAPLDLWWRRRRGSCSLPCLSHNSLVDSGRLCVMRLPMRPLAMARVVQYGAFLHPRSSVVVRPMVRPKNIYPRHLLPCCLNTKTDAHFLRTQRQPRVSQQVEMVDSV